MDKRLGLNDTIAAIATPLGEAGIGIVRLSGPESLKIAGKIFAPKGKHKPESFRTFTTHYGWIKSGSRVIDEVLLTVMRAPLSYTKEDIVEINCHGGVIAMRAVLELVLDCGCRLAEPGEFTRRAFLNGRIDLAQAEAVLDVIRAKTDAALKAGAEQLKGRFSREMARLRDRLLDALSLMEANIDFPDDEPGALDIRAIGGILNEAEDAFSKILSTARSGQILREGVHVVICGRPNVGKSSLLNALLKKERSIVTPVAGTTRDTIEEIIDIKGIPVRIVDTAGIIEPKDLVERKAVERSRKQMELADMVIVVFDASHRLNKDDFTLIKKLAKKTSIAVVNKIDLKQNIELDALKKKFKDLVFISAKKARNINLLEDAIADLVYQGVAGPSDAVLISNTRHIHALKQAKKLIEEARNSLDNKISLEFVAQSVSDAVSCLDAILGLNFSDELLDKIFSQFCIGK